MDLAQVQGFVAVARHHNFTSAARERGLTQPGLSRQVQKLERELGVTLVDRRASTLSLTPAGQRFLLFAEGLIAAHGELLAELRLGPTSLEGDLRIIASTTPGAYLVPRLVARFRDQYPKVRPEVAITDSAAVIAALHEGQWDVGFTGGSVNDSALRSSVVAEDEIVLAVPTKHPLAQKEQVRLAELAGVPFVDREEGSGTLQSLRAAFAVRHLRLPSRSTVMVLSSCQAVVAAVRQGVGVGFVSTLALADVDATEVVGVRLADLSVRRRLSFVYRKLPVLPPVVAAFVDFVEQANEEKPAGGLTIDKARS